MSNLKKEVKRIVEEQGGKTDQYAYARDVLTYGCVSGMVSELIYYTDTQKFFDEYYDDIMALVEDYQEQTGTQLQHDGDMKNFYAWFAFEETVLELYGERVGF